MSAVGLGLTSLAAMAGGAGVGHLVRRLMPAHGADASAREAVGLAIGLVITVTSLTLSLLLYSTKTGFDLAESNMRAYAATIIVLDRSLVALGAEGAPAHAMLRDYTGQALRSTWPEEFGGVEAAGPLESPALGTMLFRLHDTIRRLRPAGPGDEALAAECRSGMNTLVSQRFVLLENVRRTIPPLLLAGVIAWLAVIFAGMGANAPRTGLVMATMAVAALVAMSCIVLMDEMDGAFDGLIKVSSAPMRDALANIVADGPG